MSQNDFYNGSSPDSIGAPFDPYGKEDECSVINGRIMPFHFKYPIYPYAFTMIRNTIPEETRDPEDKKI